MKLNSALSAYLDGLRFVAALSVMVSHMDQDGLSISWLPLFRYGHEAVIIFFVLSGFIIYYSTASSAVSWRQYLVARLSRIYSVVLPAILWSLSVAVWVGMQSGFDSTKFSNYSSPAVWEIVSSLLFMNESWLNEAKVPLNGPYWSLCYEVWYYVIFGAFFFCRDRLRWWVASVAALVAGPAILVLLPIWLLGAWLASSGRYASRWTFARAWICFLGPVAIILLLNSFEVDRVVQIFLYERVPGFWRLDGSQRFLTDHIIALAVCLHIAAFSSLPAAVQGFFARYQAVLASLAGFSFTLYLFHRPMTQLLGAWYPQSSGAVWQTTLLAMGILLACWAISWGTEKQLPRWRRGFARVLLR